MRNCGRKSKGEKSGPERSRQDGSRDHFIVDSFFGSECHTYVPTTCPSFLMKRVGSLKKGGRRGV
jgi:hypothetical protein